MLINERESLGVEFLGMLFRFLWRNRSALAPLYLGALAFVASAVAHSDNRSLWLPVTLATAVLAGLLGIPHRVLKRHRHGDRIARVLARACSALGMERSTERAYGAAVVAVTGVWCGLAIAAGPINRPIPTLWWAGVIGCGIPWWIHRRRRARVRVQRIVEAWPNLAESMGLPGSRIASAVVDAWGFTARLKLRKGATAADATNRIASIESGLGVRSGSVRILPDAKRADRCVLRVVDKDPHAEPLAWPEPADASITKPFVLGLFEDARQVAVSFLRRHVLIGGVVGSGKSGVVNVVLGWLSSCRDAVIWGIDLKEGMELAPWKPCLDRLATTGQQATDLLRAGVAELERRARILAAQGQRVWEPTPENPALVIVIDEYAELPEEARVFADSIARRGRAVAVTLVVATQRPTQKTMGGATRSQMDIRICLRVRERRDTDLILGQGAAKSGWHAESLTLAGSFLLSTPEHHTPDRARAWLVDDGDVAAHVARHGPRRPAGPARAPGPAASATGPQETAQGPEDADGGPEPGSVAVEAADGPQGPDAALWSALRDAGPDGVTIGALMAASGRGRRWVYYRLRQLADGGSARQLARGRWRAVKAPGAPPRGSRRPGPKRPPGRDGR
jgi:S-DNA-T family DNA segregation ATPase FtsK/SpoIIIE